MQCWWGRENIDGLRLCLLQQRWLRLGVWRLLAAMGKKLVVAEESGEAGGLGKKMPEAAMGIVVVYYYLKITDII